MGPGWIGRSKDHVQSDLHNLEVRAVGMKLKALTASQVRTGDNDNDCCADIAQVRCRSG